MNIGRKFARQEPNEPIQARTLNRPIDAIEKLQGISVAAPLSMSNINGIPLIRDGRSRPTDARITVVGTLGKYEWQAIVGSGTGTWVDLIGFAGTLTRDPCYEANGNATLAVGTRIAMMRDPATSEWRFWYDSC